MSSTNSYVAEIQKMMYGFGDSPEPLLESAKLIEEILHQQMNSLLCQCDDIASSLRQSSIVGHEDILFLMRKDKVKLKRLLKYLELKDNEKKLSLYIESDADNVKKTKSKRVHECMSFLSSIDQTGELSSLMDEDIFDEVKFLRAVRLERHTNYMDQEEYLKYAEARQASFRKSYLKPKFKEWLLQDQPNMEQPTPLALEIFNYLAFETVAQIIDLSLLVRQDAVADPIRRLQPGFICNKEYRSAQMKGMKKDPKSVIDGTYRLRTKILNQNCIQPEDIREAISRYFRQSGPFICFSKAYEYTMNNRLLCC